MRTITQARAHGLLANHPQWLMAARILLKWKGAGEAGAPRLFGSSSLWAYLLSAGIGARVFPVPASVGQYHRDAS